MAASYHTPAYRAQPSLRGRITASLLSGGILALLILALLWVTAAPFIDSQRGDSLSTFNVAPGPVAAERSKAQQPRPPAEPRPAPPPAAARRPETPVADTPAVTLPGVLSVDRATFAGSNVGKLPSDRSGQGKATEVAEAGGGGGGRAGAGDRETVLHDADWYRKPTRAEIGPFMPPRQQEGWGMIACRTADRFRVEDCRELGETPGSGIARGLRRAAWQFLVRPPMVDGKPQIGAWVRIRFDLVRGLEE